MARKKKSRKVSDIMPARKADKKPVVEKPRSGKKLTRYELDAKAREDKRKKKHKGRPAGSRHSSVAEQKPAAQQGSQDPRIGSRKQVPLIVEYVNRDHKAPPSLEKPKPTALDPLVELEQLENNEILNELLDQLEAGRILKPKDQAFVDECLQRVEQLMQQLGLEQEEENDEDLYRTFEKINLNQFR